MENFQTLSWELLSAYVIDSKTTLGPEIFKHVAGMLRARDFKGLTSCTKTFGAQALSRAQYATLMQVESFLKKNLAFTSPNAEDVAFASFLRCEKRNARSNRRLEWYWFKRDRFQQKHPDLDRYLSRMEQWISRCLGEYNDFLEILPELVRFTAGATESSPRSKSLPWRKPKLRMRATTASVPYLTALATWFGYEGFGVIPTQENRLTIVPKNWETGRTIACEPEGCLPLQLAFDTYAKRQLRAFARIDLSDQSRNQRFALEGSMYGDIATIDLKDASNSTVTNAVAWLFPEPWAQYLASVRSTCWRFKDRKRGLVVKGSYNMFSSMGNGSTFAIETLIFAAACSAVGSKHFTVYGDDIAIEVELVEPLLRVLRFLGFVPNLEKSHACGPFRESCGVNYFAGVDVTPFKVREMDGRKAVLCHNVNGLAAIAAPGGQLEKRLLKLVIDRHLRLVPWNDNSMSGVFIPPSMAYAQGLLKKPRDMKTRHVLPFLTPWYKAYTPQTKVHRAGFIRGLTYWYFKFSTRKNWVEEMYARIEAERRRHFPGSTQKAVELITDRETSESSRYTESSGYYTSTWVHWFPPVASCPLHLYRWGELLIA